MLAHGVFSLDPQQGLDAWAFHQGNKVWVNFRGPQTLLPDDMKVLHAVAAAGYVDYRAKNGRRVITADQNQGLASLLSLETDGAAVVTRYETSLRELAEFAGMGQGSDRLMATWNSLKRLAEVSVWTYTLASPDTPNHLTKKLQVTIGRGANAYTETLRCSSVVKSGFLHSMRLEGNGGLQILLNPRQAVELLGEGRNYTIISMPEVRQIRSGATSLLHGRLCAFIDPGKRCVVSMVRMQEYVWGEALDGNADVRDVKYRRRVLNRCLADLQELGWMIEVRRKDSWMIQRPSSIFAQAELLGPPQTS
jgi:hypothetical protein